MGKGIRVEVDGMDEVQTMIKRFTKDTPQEANRLANRFMLKVERGGKVESPVLTGRLRTSIFSRLMGFTKGSFVSTDTNYAVFPHIKNPYMFRAVDSGLTFLTREINKMIDRLAR